MQLGVIVQVQTQTSVARPLGCLGNANPLATHPQVVEDAGISGQVPHEHLAVARHANLLGAGERLEQTGAGPASKHIAGFPPSFHDRSPRKRGREQASSHFHFGQFRHLRVVARIGVELCSTGLSSVEMLDARICG